MKRSVLVVAAAAGAVLLAACGSSGGSATATQSNPTSGGAANITVQTTSLGQVLADSSGHTLYLLTADRTKLACTGGCLGLWPPVQVPHGTKPQAASGVTGAMSVVARGSNDQITVGGHPVYTYSGDDGQAQTHGEGISSFGGTWYAVSPAGVPVMGSGGSAPMPSQTSNGYSY
jgi:predicted lipoprotein with Yx(FWY)xxD motif